METCFPNSVVDRSGETFIGEDARTIRVAPDEVKTIRAEDIRAFGPAVGEHAQTSKGMLRIVCVTGVVWLTHAREDVVLRAGEHVALDRLAGKVLVQALSDEGAVVRVSRPSTPD